MAAVVAVAVAVAAPEQQPYGSLCPMGHGLGSGPQTVTRRSCSWGKMSDESAANVIGAAFLGQHPPPRFQSQTCAYPVGHWHTYAAGTASPLPQGCIGGGGGGAGRYPLPPSRAPSHCPPDGNYQLQWHL